MKRLLVILIFVAILVSNLASCAQKRASEETDDYLITSGVFSQSYYELIQDKIKQFKNLGFFGEHQLSSFKANDDVNSEFSGDFFLGTGSISGKTVSAKEVVFVWKLDGNEKYLVPSSFPVEKIRMIIDETKKIPTIRFQWDIIKVKSSPNIQANNPGSFIRPELISYATVRAKEKDLQIFSSGSG
ncbi:MAG: hypothetical protein NTV62_01985, partial [Candidatus Gribaldobacteria bacterium]|nr:hypothetical protein [Candidatus Gribaldobacteria bacterium]